MKIHGQGASLWKNDKARGRCILYLFMIKQDKREKMLIVLMLHALFHIKKDSWVLNDIIHHECYDGYIIVHYDTEKFSK